jgi:hypothetical protein
MKKMRWLAAGLLLVASPAFATSSILCRSTISPTDGPELWLVVGTSAASGILQARFSHGSESFTTGENSAAPAIAQAWIDERQLKLNVADANAETVILRLDTRRRGGRAWSGILIHHGRTWRVRCSEEG